MTTSKVVYSGGLRTTCTHARSGDHFNTDAPVDNNGRGEAFSPTDTVATGLASCMITMMGIRAGAEGWNIDGTEAEVLKIMGSGPRRITEVHVSLKIPGRDLKEDSRKLLEQIARSCPVAQSLHPDIVQKIEFEYI